MRALVLAALAVSGCTHHPAIGDGRALIGARVRVEVNQGAEEEGVVVADRDGITVSTGSGDVSLWQTYKVTAVKRGRGALEGLGLGIVIAGGTGALIGLASGDDECDPDRECFLAFTAGEKAVITGVVFGSLGGLLGLLVGVAFGSRDVYEIAGSAPPTPRFVPSGPPGSAAGMTFHF